MAFFNAAMRSSPRPATLFVKVRPKILYLVMLLGIFVFNGRATKKEKHSSTKPSPTCLVAFNSFITSMLTTPSVLWAMSWDFQSKESVRSHRVFKMSCVAADAFDELPRFTKQV